jgi:hypothetical protein
MAEDPELRRVAELLVQQRAGRLADAETEELALYVDEQPSLVEAARARLGELMLPTSRDAPSDDDPAWLDRLHGDRALAEAHSTPRTRAERGVGLGLIGVGFGLAIFGWWVGPVMAGVGVLTLLASFIRVRVTARDPYDRIER